MALASYALPYGLREVVLFPISDAGVVGTGVKLPASRTLSFSEAEDFEELRGDDRVIAIRGKGPIIDWDLEAGGISLEAYKVMAGGTITSTGTTPAESETLTKKTTDSRPYFKVEGRALSDTGGDFHVILYKCRASDSLEGEFSEGTFWLTSASGQAIGDANDKLYDFVHNETATAIVSSP